MRCIARAEERGSQSKDRELGNGESRKGGGGRNSEEYSGVTTRLLGEDVGQREEDIPCVHPTTPKAYSRTALALGSFF